MADALKRRGEGRVGRFRWLSWFSKIKLVQKIDAGHMIAFVALFMSAISLFQSRTAIEDARQARLDAAVEKLKFQPLASMMTIQQLLRSYLVGEVQPEAL